MKTIYVVYIETHDIGGGCPDLPDSGYTSLEEARKRQNEIYRDGIKNFKERFDIDEDFLTISGGGGEESELCIEYGPICLRTHIKSCQLLEDVELTAGQQIWYVQMDNSFDKLFDVLESCWTSQELAEKHIQEVFEEKLKTFPNPDSLRIEKESDEITVIGEEVFFNIYVLGYGPIFNTVKEYSEYDNNK